jgi:pimeloyl-ACP methyl ester carboxylesterase
MATMILVPGAMHGAWIWKRVTPLLERAGFEVIARDLPGMGADRSMATERITLDLWAEFVAGLVRDAEAPVILAAHSRGGVVIGEAAERVAERVQGLIYVTALIVPPGQIGLTAGTRDLGTPVAPDPASRQPMTLPAE